MAYIREYPRALTVSLSKNMKLFRHDLLDYHNTLTQQEVDFLFPKTESFPEIVLLLYSLGTVTVSIKIPNASHVFQRTCFVRVDVFSQSLSLA